MKLLSDKVTAGKLPVRLVEVILGVVFAYASYHKIADPVDFAHMVYMYKMTPGSLINLIAIYLPWIELVTGIVLIFGIPGRRGAALLTGLMLLVFMGAIGFNLARGHPVDCGCFEGSGTHTKTREQLFGEMWWVLIRDAGMLLMVGFAFFWHPRSGRLPEEPGEGKAPLEPAGAPAA